jgi:hypothetical protein
MKRELYRNGKPSKNLDSLKRAIKSAEKRRTEEERREEAEINEEKRAERKFWQEERTKFDEKLRLAEEIFLWSKEFTHSGEGRKLFKIGGGDYLVLYHNGWGHEPEGKHGSDCASRLYLRKDGTLHYNTRFKWFPYPYERTFETARELAKTLAMYYINDLHRSITTGHVYDELQKNLKTI